MYAANGIRSAETRSRTESESWLLAGRSVGGTDRDELEAERAIEMEP
jgi:hypothetical protein